MPSRPGTSTSRYAGLATQWAVMLGLAVWGGLKLDRRLGLKALFVILFPVVALGYSLYQVIREFNKPKK